MDSQTESTAKPIMIEQEPIAYASREVDPVRRINTVLQTQWQRALATDQYEVATQALGEVSVFRNWRQISQRSPFSQFYQLVEAGTLLNNANASAEQRQLVADQLIRNAITLSPRVRDLYKGLLATVDGSEYSPEFSMTEAQLKALQDSGDLALLSDATIPWDLKLNRMQTRIESELRGRKALDRRLKDDPEYQVGTLTEWLQLKISSFLNQVDVGDQDKIRALFEHYHLFDKPPQLRNAQPIIPKEIGYLSPRIPRPLHVAEAAPVHEDLQALIRPEQRPHNDIQCMLEDGTTTFARLEPFSFDKQGKTIRLKNGSRFILDGEKFRFVGVGGDGIAVARVDTGRADEALHRLIDMGLLEEGGEFSTAIEEAEELFGEDFLGPEQVEKAFGIEVADIPDLPYEQAELQRAKELGQMLVLRTDQAPDGRPLTMQKMMELLQPKFDAGGRGKVLYDTYWYKNEKFFTEGKPTSRWALVSKTVIPNSTNKNYVEQTQVLADYLANEIFPGAPVPADYQAAIREFESQKGDLTSLMGRDWQVATRRLSELKLNQLTRRTPSEELYDILLYFQNTDKRLLEDKYDWTTARSSFDRLVRVGDFNSGGVYVDRWDPGHKASFLGVRLSRG